jgi:hypothetical protein
MVIRVMRLCRRSAALATLLGLFLFGLSAAPSAYAAGHDASVSNSVQSILANDIPNANYGDARRKLKALGEKCKRGCTPQTVAKIDVALAVVASQIGQTEEAKTLFADAIALDRNVDLPGVASPAATAMYTEAKTAAPTAKAPPPTAVENKDKRAAELVVAATTAALAGNTDVCIQKATESLTIEEQPRTRLILAGCDQNAGKLLDALRESKKALEAGIQKRDVTLAREAAGRVEELLKRVPHVTFAPPTTGGVTDIKTTFDDKPVPPESWNKPFSVDPGTHKIHAEGMANDIKLVFDQSLDFKDTQSLTVRITLKPESPKFLTEGQMICMRTAQSQDEVAKCLPDAKPPIVVRVGVAMSAYGDTTATRVYSPSLNAAVTSPTAGWNVGASYLIDVVSSASPDIVSTASRNFHDTRHAVSVHGGYKPARFGFDAAASYSGESDYISRSAHVGVLGDFANKQFTPRLGLGHTADTLGRAGQGFNDYSHGFSINDIDLGATFVLSAKSIAAVGFSSAFERGDQSKSYRLIPMFGNDVNIPLAASISSVNANRLPVRPYEQLPVARDRYALAGLYATRTGRATLRVEERVYRDSWAVLASTTDARYIYDLTPRLSVWPHARIHAQTGASFYERAYHAEIAPVVQVPTYRTTDRELSPFLAITVGGGARLNLSPPSARFRYALTGTADALGARYLNAIYIRDRIAIYGSLGFEAEFE